MNDKENIKRNPYINEDGQRELHKSIIAFVDILGFKDLVRNAKKKGKSQEVFKDFHHVLSTWFNRIEEMQKKSFEMPFIGGRKDDYTIRIFTDCIVIGCPIKQDGNRYNFIEGCNEFFDILTTLYIFQLEMINQGYFVRGAIAVDELYMDDIIIYGNGISEAYEAESKLAKFPRIILTESAETMFMQIDEAFCKNKGQNYLTPYLYKDEDGLLFLNYLESIKIGESNYEFVDELEKHKQLLEEKLSEYKNKLQILEKYIWVAKYHNFFCNQPPYYNDYFVDLSQYQMQSFDRNKT